MSDKAVTAMPSEDLADLYENAPCGHLSLSPDGRIVKSNATLSAWIGRSAENLLGLRLHELMTVPSRIFLETHAIPLLRMRGGFQEIALDLLTSDDRLAVIAAAAERRDGDGALLSTRVVFVRAAERRRLEREVRDLNTELETRVAEAGVARWRSERGLVAERALGELREQFIAVLGHDLRNPLASIDSGVRILLRESQSEKSQMVLGLMQGSVVRMAALIDDVMDLARSRLGGGIGLKRNPREPLGQVILQVAAELQAGTHGSRVETTIDLPEPINCDPARVGQMVSNLLGNALNHGAKDKPVRLDARVLDGTFELSVSNAGTPIPPEAMDMLFQPFFRGEVRNNQQGLGLGLHIASEIAKAHGGTLAATSTEDETRFTFRMPMDASVVE